MFTVNVVDSICGKGKTTAIINFIKRNRARRCRFMYVTPYLNEVERIMKSCRSKQFYSPKVYGNKSNGLISLLKEKRNVVITHALFKQLANVSFDSNLLNDYILIMDEVADVMYTSELSRDDARMMIQSLAKIDKDRVLHWEAKDYNAGKFLFERNMIEKTKTVIFGREEKVYLINMYPKCIYESFADIFLLTYMFDGQIQRCYFDYLSAEIKYWHVEGNEIVIGKNIDTGIEYKDLIHIYDDEKLNSIGNSNGSLSMNWFLKDSQNGFKLCNKLKNNLYNYIRNILKVSVNDAIWTTFKEYEQHVKKHGVSGGYVSLNMRATNDYRDKSCIVYFANRYINPFFKNFFINQNIKVNEDMFALSELIQFMFRTQIRNGQEINIYIPSKRMRTLLIRWLDGETFEDKIIDSDNSNVNEDYSDLTFLLPCDIIRNNMI